MTSIYVGNLSHTATEDDLRNAFAAFGAVSNVTIIKDRETEVAKIVPIRERSLAFRVIPASRPSKGIDDMAGFRPTGVTPEEIERIFAETRADRIDEWLNLDKSTSTRR